MKKPVSLITGACGFIGSHMAEVLSEAGHEVRATDLESAYQRDDKVNGRFPSVLKNLGVTFIPSDMTKPETLEEVVKDVDFVFHIASIFSYSAPWEDLKRVNVDGTRSLCNLLVKESHLKRLVLWGAGGVYGLPKKEELPLTERHPVNPANNYLRAKALQEQLVMDFGRTRGLPYSIIRPTTVYGPRAVYGSGQLLIPLAKMPVITVPMNFNFHIPFVHVRDVCGAALYLSDKLEAQGQIYNLNDDTLITNVEFLRFMANITGKPFIPAPPVPIRPLRAGLILLSQGIEMVTKRLGIKSPLESDSVAYLGVDFLYSNEKLKSTGYSFIYPDARDGIRETMRWYKEAGWL